MPSIQLLDQYKFTFSRDEEGYLSTYTVEQLGRFVQKNNLSHGAESYRVKVKRK